MCLIGSVIKLTEILLSSWLINELSWTQWIEFHCLHRDIGLFTCMIKCVAVLNIKIYRSVRQYNHIKQFLIKTIQPDKYWTMPYFEEYCGQSLPIHPRNLTEQDFCYFSFCTVHVLAKFTQAYILVKIVLMRLSMLLVENRAHPCICCFHSI